MPPLFTRTLDRKIALYYIGDSLFYQQPAILAIAKTGATVKPEFEVVSISRIF